MQIKNRFWILYLILVIMLIPLVHGRSFIVHNTTNESHTFFAVNGSTGYVGIGTDSPGVALDVNGKIRLSGSSIDIQGYTGAAYTAINYDSLTHSFQTSGGSSDLFIDTDGDVGIATTSPAEKLVVIGNVNVSGTLNVSGRVAFPDLGTCAGKIYTTSGGVLACGVDQGGSGAAGNSTAWNKTGTDVILANNGDLVGIGTNTPSEILSLTQNGATIIFNHTSTSLPQGEPIGEIAFYNPDISTTGNVAAYVKAVTSASTGVGGEITFGTSISTGSGAATETVRIDGRGNLGINTTTPAQTLTVQGTMNITPAGQGATPSLFVNSSGNVGIGIVGAKQELHIADTSAPSTLYTTDTTGHTNSDGFNVGYDSGNNYAIIWNRENEPIVFATNNGEDMRIAGSGNLGIGATNPAHKLTVSGTANITGAIRFENFDACTALETDADGDLVCGTDEGSSGALTNSTAWNRTGTDVILANNGDQVGFGVDAPDTKLTIKGQENNPWLRVHRSDSTTDQFEIVTVEGGSYTTESGISSGIWTNVIDSSNSDLMLTTNNAGGTGGDILLDGIVGIGTTAPSTKLHVKTNDTNNFSTTNVLTLEHVVNNPLNSTGGLGVGVLFRGMDNGSNIDDIAMINATLIDAVNGTEDSSLGFYTRTAGGALSPALFINGSNVGVGTTGPGQLLVVGTPVSSIRGNFVVETDSNDEAIHINELDGGGENWGIGVNSAGDLVFRDSNTQRITFQDDGNVGIGTTKPIAEFEVAGSGVIAVLNSSEKTQGMWTEYLTMVGQDYSVGSMSDKFHIMLSTDNNQDPWSGTSLVAVDLNGNVGIGATNPAKTLTVAGTANITGAIRFENFDACTALETDADGDLVCGSDAGGDSGTQNSTAWNRTGTNVILANLGDNVGIGTVSPTAILDINDTSTDGRFIFEQGGNANTNSLSIGSHSSANDGYARLLSWVDSAGFALTSNYNPTSSAADGDAVEQGTHDYTSRGGTQILGLASTTTTSKIKFGISAAGGGTVTSKTMMVVQGDGKIGIGTETPNAILHVNGTSGALLNITNGTAETHLYVDGDTGFVGIGTDSPTQKLEVSGTGTFGNSDTGVMIQGNQGDIIGVDVGSVAYNDLELRAGGAGTGILINTNGNVGIAATNPAHKLTVSGTANITGAIRFENFDACTALETDADGDLVCGSDAGGASGTQNSTAWNLTDNVVVLADTTDNVSVNTSVLFVDTTNDRVGIGTDSPGSKLEINGDLEFTSTAVIKAINSGTDDLSIYADADLFLGTSSVDTITIGRSSDNVPIKFQAGSAGEIMRIINSQIGIGTQTPNAKLQINGTSGALLNITNGTAETHLMVDGDTGFVGIGDTSPDAPLEIYRADSGILLHLDGNSNAYVDLDRSATNREGSYMLSTADVIDWVMGVADSDEAGDGTEYFIGTGQTATTAKLWIEIDGSVGIGTTAPANRLEVAGNVSLQGNTSIGMNTLFVDNTSSRVGIGTTSPGAIFEVSSDAGNAASGNIANFLNTNAGDDDVDFIYIGGSETNNDALGIGFDETSNYGWMSIHGDSAGASLVIADGGNVGIAATNPAHKLTVSGTANITGAIRFENFDACTALETDADGDLVCGSDAGGDSGSQNSTAWNKTNNLVYLSNTTDRVGIGTSSPTEVLTVKGNDVKFKESTGNDEDRIYFFMGESGSNAYIDVFDNAENINVHLDGLQDSYLNVQGGNVGIGTASPANKLEVAGNVSLQGNTSIGMNTLFVDNTSSRVGIGTTAPTEQLDVVGDIKASSKLITDRVRAIDGDGLDLVDDGGNGIKVIDGGNVGIAATNPAKTLTVSGTANITGAIRFENFDACTALETDADGDLVCGSDAGGASGTQNSTAWNRTSTNVLLANQNDNVGIGVSSPTSKLHVSGNANISGLCVAENSLITMADETEKLITDIKPGDYVKSLDEQSGKIVTNKVKAVLDMGYKPIFEVKTSSGRSVNTTGNHPYLTENGWIKVENLNVDDYIAVTKNKKENGSLNQEGSSVQDIHYNYNKIYKPFGFSSGSAKPRMLNQVERLPEKQVSVQDMRVQNSFLFGDDSPVRGALTHSDITFDKIISIRVLEPQHVYDLMIENTHNFIANGILAHNTYIYDNTSVDDTTLFVDTTNDRVGIGTTGPGSPLQIDGAYNSVLSPAVLRLQSTDASAVDTGSTLAFWGGSGNAVDPYYFGGIKGAKETSTAGSYAGYLALYTVAGTGTSESNSQIYERMRITSTGAVGIGTTTPSTKLHVKVNDTNNFSTTNVLTLEHVVNNPLNSTGGLGVGVLFRGMDNGSNIVDIAMINATLTDAINGSEDSALGFYTRTAGGALSPALFINGSNVGIGTTSPTSDLQVDGGSGEGIITGPTDGTLRLHSERSMYLILDSDTGETDRVLSVYKDSASAANELFRVEESGNIGIAATNPAHKLTVSGTANITGAIRFENFDACTALETDADGDLVCGSDAGGASGTQNSTAWNLTDNVVVLADPTDNMSVNTSVLFVDTTNDRVGIGTDSPSEKLQIGTADAATYAILALDRAKFGYTGDHVYVGSDNDKDIRFYTDSDAARMTILQSNGNIGINTTTPAQTLTVQGTLNVTADQSGSPNIFVNSTGGVGIGTASPSRLLEVADTGTTDREGIMTSRESHSVGMGVDRAGTNWGLGLYIDGTQKFNIDSNAGVTIGDSYFGSDPPADGVLIEGNVGIGTTTPTDKLVVAGNANVTGNLVIGADGSGNVGIGTSSPSSELDITGNVIITDGTESCSNTDNGDLCVDNDLEVDGIITANTIVVNQNLYVIGNISNTNVINLSVNGSITPPLDNIFDLGAADKRWQDVWATNIRGNNVYVSGNAAIHAGTNWGGDLGGTGTSPTVDNTKCTGDQEYLDGTGNCDTIDELGDLTDDVGFQIAADAFNWANNMSALLDNATVNRSIDLSGYQIDVGSDCAAGQYAKGVDDDGTLDCATPDGASGTANSTAWNKTNNLVLLANKTDSVGIGTNAPASSLQVHNSDANDHLIISGTAPSIKLADEEGGTEDAAIGLATSGGHFVTGSAANDLVIRTKTADGDILLATNTGPTERMRVTDAGNVGINTSSPTQTLTVQGTMNVTADQTGGSNLFVASDGQVGVGTVDPLTKVEVDGDPTGSPNTVLVQMGGSGANTGTTFRVYRNRASGGTNSAVAEIANDAATDDQVLLVLDQDAPADIINVFDTDIEVFTILDGGYVGINTSNPSYLLTIADTTGSGLSMNVSGVLYVNGSSGNVGIGTSSPSEALEVNGNIRIPEGGYIDTGDGQYDIYMGDTSTTGQYGTLWVKASLDDSTGIKIYPRDEAGSPTTFAHFGYNANNDYVTIGTASDADSLIVDTASNVGIGTTSPGRKLEVSGSMNATELNISGSANLAYGSGNVGIGTAELRTGYKLDVRGSIVSSDGTDQGFISLRGDRDDVKIYESADYVIHLDAPSGVAMDIDNNDNGGLGFHVKDDGASIFYVQDGGNVGISASNPAKTLTVAGTANITGAVRLENFDACTALETDADGDLVCGSDAGGDSGTQNSTAWNRTGTDVLLANQGDYVGIGATNPAHMLTVYGTSNERPMLNITTDDNDGFYIDDDGQIGVRVINPSEIFVIGSDLGDVGGSNAVMVIGDGSGGQVVLGESSNERVHMYYHDDTNGLAFKTVDTTEYDFTLMLHNGDVGINTTEPRARLDFRGDSILAPGKFSINEEDETKFMIGTANIQIIELTRNKYAEETYSNGAVSTDSSDLDLGRDSTTQESAVRYSASIPRNAIIASAHLVFQVDGAQDEETNLTIWGEDTDNSIVFAESTNNVTNRVKTSNYIQWDRIARWDLVGEWRLSPDISKVIKEVIDRPGWIIGNNLSIIINGSGKREAENSPRLVVSYTVNHTSSSFIVNNFGDGMFSIKTNHTDKFVVDKDGQVGIGTANPAHTLSVLGTANITGAVRLENFDACTALETDADGDLVCGSDAGGASGTQNSTAWNLTNNQVILADPTDNMSVNGSILFVDTTNDRVGINTSSPSNALDVTGDIELSGGTRTIWTDTGEYDIRLKPSDDIWIHLDDDGGDTGYFGIVDQSDNTIFSVNEDSSVLIDNPGSDEAHIEFNTGASNEGYIGLVGAAAELASDSAANDIVLRSDDGDIRFVSNFDGGYTDTAVIIKQGDKMGINTSSPAQTLTVQGTFNVTSDQGGTPDLFVDSDGQVGIGTSTPSAMLEVTNDISINAAENAYFMVNTPSDDYAGLRIVKGGSDEWFIQQPADSADLRITDNDGVGDMVTFESGGNVGIGNTNPNVTLDVSGDANVSGTFTTGNINTGDGAMELGDAAVANGDTNSIPTGDQVYDFVIAQGYGTDEVGALTNTYACYTDGSDVLCDDAGFVFITGTDELQIDGPLQLDGNSIESSVAEAISLSNDDASVVGCLNVGSTSECTTQGDIQLSGDITMTDDDHIGISASDERIHFDANGEIEIMGANVGIGTQTPTDPLDVNGNTTIRGNLTVGSNALFVNASGRVGIGTTEPAAIFHSVRASGQGLPSFGLGAAAVFQANQNTGDWANIAIIGGQTGASHLNFGDKDNAGAGFLLYGHSDNHFAFWINSDEKVRIDSNGDVGIGTSVPAQKLTVQGTLNATADGEGGADLFVATNGYVGVNETSPTKPLHVAGSVNVSGSGSRVYVGGGGYMYSNGTTLILGHD